MTIELRIYRVNCDKNVADYIVKAIQDYLKNLGLSFIAKELIDEKLMTSIRKNTTYEGVDAGALVKELAIEKQDIREGRINDVPHWDCVILGSKFAFGFAVSKGIIFNEKTDIECHNMVFTTALGADAIYKGYILGMHETHHVFEDKHCKYAVPWCFFQPGELSGQKLQMQADKMKEMMRVKGRFQVPACEYHSQFIPSL